MFQNAATDVEEFSENHPFSYERMFGERSTIPTLVIDGIEYDSSYNGGWMRIRSDKGVNYYLAQAQLEHLAPDWKLHFSIHAEDMPRAWNIIGHLFLAKKCNMSMKMCVPDYDSAGWPQHMYGREITVYMYTHQDIYTLLSGNALFAREKYSAGFWFDFINAAELQLKKAGIRSRGTADGDRALGNYVSIRNESYIEVDASWRQITNQCVVSGRRFCYPPNCAGYNASNYKDPLIQSGYSCSLFSSSQLPRHLDVLKQVTDVVQRTETASLAEQIRQQKIIPPMLSIHIKAFASDSDYNQIMKRELVVVLYHLFLKEDSWFHFFYEPELVVRVSTVKNLDAIQGYLREKNIECVVYDYPYPSLSEHRAFGENPEGTVSRYLNMFLKIYHMQAKAALDLSPEAYLVYIHRVVEEVLSTSLQAANCSALKGQYLDALAAYKLKREVSFSTEPVDESLHLSFQALQEGEFSIMDDQALNDFVRIMSGLSKVARTLMVPGTDELSYETFSYLERVIHIMFNMGGYSREEEGEYLVSLAAKELGLFAAYCKEPGIGFKI